MNTHASASGADVPAGLAFDTGVATWSSPAWRALAMSWMDERLAAAGLERTGELEQPHLRPWATVLTAPTTGGTVWLKATGPSAAFEVGLYDVLHRVVPDYVLVPIAVDRGRKWIILPDGGPKLADLLDSVDLADAMASALARYGRLQRELMLHADDLLELGVADMRPRIMPERFDEALGAVSEYVARHGSDADRETYQHLVALRDVFASWCDQLAALPGPSSIDHNDLHPWNILVAGPDDLHRANFYDWGDSVVAHPFASMLVPLGYVRDTFGVDDDDPRVRRVKDAYLAVFCDLAPYAELVEALELACRIGKVARALTWHRALETAGAGTIDNDFASAPWQSMCALLDDSWLGGA